MSIKDDILKSYSATMNKWKESVENRDKVNRMIFHTYQFMEVEKEYPGTHAEIEENLDKCSELRFGQVICNKICPDYRDEIISDKTAFIMNRLFRDIDMDPFYEEPDKTWNRLNNEAEKMQIG